MELGLHNLLSMVWGAGVLALIIFFSHQTERTTSRVIAKHLGWRGVLVTGWLGVSVHELSHLVAAKLFGHRIIGWRLFDPDPQTRTLGYVRHAYTRRNLWQLAGSFVIGLAPLIAGCLALTLLAGWMLSFETLWALALHQGVESSTAPSSPETETWHAVTSGLLNSLSLLASICTQIVKGATPWLPLQLYLGLAISSHMAPSRADLRGGSLGACLFVVIATAVALICGLWGIQLSRVAAFPIVLLPFVVIATVFQLAYAMAVSLVARSKTPLKRNKSPLTLAAPR